VITRLSWGIIYGLIVLLFVFSLFLYGEALLEHAFTPDLPWLLATGDNILKHHQLPFHDIFSWSFPARPWVLYQWLFEVLTTWAYHLLGEQGLLRAFIVFVGGLYLVLPLYLGRKQSIPMAFTLFVSMLAMLTIVVNISLRPMLVTALFLAIQWLVVEGVSRKKLSQKWAFVVLGGIYVLWGNMHTGVTLGLFSLALMAVGDWLEKQTFYSFLPTDPSIEGQPLGIRFYSLLIALGFLASLLNPYGFTIYQYLVHLSSQRYLDDVILELQSPNFHWSPYQCFMGLLIVFVLVLPWARSIFSCKALLHLMVFTFCLLFVQRFVVWTCLFYVLILPKALYQWHLSINNRPDQKMYAFVQGFEIFRPLVYLTILLVSGMFLFLPHYFQKAEYGDCKPFMAGIDAYQKLKQPSDRVMHDAVVGSCSLYKYPASKVFIDTRFDFYGQDFMRGQRFTTFLFGDWKGFIQKWHLNTFVLPKEKPLARLLMASPEYNQLYEDQSMVILRHK
jgi:hypothetical protein